MSVLLLPGRWSAHLRVGVHSFLTFQSCASYQSCYQMFRLKRLIRAFKTPFSHRKAVRLTKACAHRHEDAPPSSPTLPRRRFYFKNSCTVLPLLFPSPSPHTAGIPQLPSRLLRHRYIISVHRISVCREHQMFWGTKMTLLPA